MRQYFVSLVLAGALVGAALTADAQQPQPPQQQPQAAPQTAAPSGGGGSFGANAPAANPFPDGPGKEIVSVACTQCHGPNVFTQLRMGEKAWRGAIYDMILRGAQIGPEDIETATKYMVASYGPGVPFPGQQPAQVTLADGQGKELVQGGCALCHGLDRVVATNRPKDQWRLIVDRMVYFGAPLTPEQTSGIVDYLAANYSPKKTAAK
jgi:mono/diheme cytochrome c family protein